MAADYGGSRLNGIRALDDIAARTIGVRAIGIGVRVLRAEAIGVACGAGIRLELRSVSKGQLAFRHSNTSLGLGDAA